MLVLLVIPILVAGFIACHIHPVHSYKLHRYAGQYLYLKCAELGLKSFGVAITLAALGHWLLPDRLSIGIATIPLTWPVSVAERISSAGVMTPERSLQTSWLLLLSALTCFASWLLMIWGHLMLYWRYGTPNARIFIIRDLLEDSPLDDLLFRLSLQKDKYAMLTMEDRKVYVGKIISLGEPSETTGMDQDISIIPLMSGYRDKDTLRVTFTTDYDRVDSDIYLSLRQEQITSATEFNFEAYQTWQASRKQPQRKLLAAKTATRSR